MIFLTNVRSPIKYMFENEIAIIYIYIRFNPSVGNIIDYIYIFQYHNKEWTLWDRFEIEGDMTLQQFIDYFKVSV